MEGTTTATTTTIIQTTSASAAVHLVLTVSGASVNVTEVKKSHQRVTLERKLHMSECTHVSRTYKYNF